MLKNQRQGFRGAGLIVFELLGLPIQLISFLLHLQCARHCTNPKRQSHFLKELIQKAMTSSPFQIRLYSLKSQYSPVLSDSGYIAVNKQSGNYYNAPELSLFAVSSAFFSVMLTFQCTEGEKKCLKCSDQP